MKLSGTNGYTYSVSTLTLLVLITSAEFPKPVKVIEEALMEVADLKKPPGSSVTAEDLLLLVDLFYLPYSHGVRAKQIVTEFKWLKNNAIKEDSEEFRELTEDEQTAKVLACHFTSCRYTFSKKVCHP